MESPLTGRQLATLAECAEWELAIKVKCRQCHHEAVLDPAELQRQCRARGASEMVDQVVQRLRCGECGARDVECVQI